MKKEKLYFTRYHDQWRGKDIELIEDEKNVYDLYIQIPDTDMEDGSVNTITANFSTEADEFIQTCFCEVFDASKRMIKLTMPTYILSNNGLYKVNFEISYNQIGSDKTNEKTAIQTFTIVDSINISEGGLVEDISEDRYNELIKEIKKLGEYKVDTSNYATKEEVNKAVEDALNGVSLENIMAQLKDKYVTVEDFEKIIGSYATVTDVNSQIKDIKTMLNNFKINVTQNYATKKETENVRTEMINRLNNYVEKQVGKDLSSNDFTDALKEKLVNLPDDGTDYDDTELRELIKKEGQSIHDAIIRYVDGKISGIDLSEYFTKEEVEKIIEDVYTKHNKDIENIVIDVENTYLKKEDYKYANGVNIDDVYVDEQTSLNDLLEELRYEEIEIKDFSTNFITDIFEASVGTTLESVTFNWELNKTPNAQYINGLEISNNLTTYTFNGSINDTVSFTLTVSDGKVEKEKSIEVSFVKPYYYGWHMANYLNTILIETGTKIIDKRRTQTVNMSYNDAKVFFAYPEEYGYLSEIKDNNGFSYINDFTPSVMYIKDSNYIVYHFDDRVSVENISFTFFFEEEEE